MGGSPTQAKLDYQRHAMKLPLQRVGYGVDGEMLAAPPESTPTPTATPKPTNGTTSMSPNSYGRDATKPLSSMEAIDQGLK